MEWRDGAAVLSSCEHIIVDQKYFADVLDVPIYKIRYIPRNARYKCLIILWFVLWDDATGALG